MRKVENLPISHPPVLCYILHTWSFFTRHRFQFGKRKFYGCFPVSNRYMITVRQAQYQFRLSLSQQSFNRSDKTHKYTYTNLNAISWRRELFSVTRDTQQIDAPFSSALLRQTVSNKCPRCSVKTAIFSHCFSFISYLAFPSPSNLSTGVRTNAASLTYAYMWIQSRQT